ncbi:phage tail protein [Xenorhabdus thuongxuanensis]|uniref:Phage tail protein n=1 Tax=Xenorhabdus thuongxuanensis TaxID=1873484 RepID=A0A1Q5U3R9_9GAMM|nr:phage tail protein [Xenorhabdus thuongxuanensis]OKP07122.1 hypothetical protein Xentx_01726 [Xenorhabdus thuongxuanensis]
MQGVEQAIKNLNQLSHRLVPTATAQAVNRVAARTMSRSVKRVARETRIPQKLIRQRVRFRRASSHRTPPRARLVVNRGNLPAIALGHVRLQLSRRKGTPFGRGSVLKAGRFTFKNAFIQRLANGRWHILQRQGPARYPIDVVKIPLVTPLTKAYREESEKLLQTDMPKELAAALKHQLRLYIQGKR